MSKETWEHIKSLKEEFINGDAIAVIWTTEDVFTESENYGDTDYDHLQPHIDTEISEEEAQKILEILDRKHDASIGISWDTISCHIDEIIHDRIEKGELNES